MDPCLVDHHGEDAGDLVDVRVADSDVVADRQRAVRCELEGADRKAGVDEREGGEEGTPGVSRDLLAAAYDCAHLHDAAVTCGKDCHLLAGLAAGYVQSRAVLYETADKTILQTIADCLERVPAGRLCAGGREAEEKDCGGCRDDRSIHGFLLLWSRTLPDTVCSVVRIDLPVVVQVGAICTKRRRKPRSGIPVRQ